MASRKQIIQIEITADGYYGTKLRIPWLTSTIATALHDKSDIVRIEVKEVVKR